MKLLTFLSLVVGVLRIAFPLYAHPGTGVAYDTEKTVTLKGMDLGQPAWRAFVRRD
jgi:hypothetical protein